MNSLGAREKTTLMFKRTTRKKKMLKLKKETHRLHRMTTKKMIQKLHHFHNSKCFVHITTCTLKTNPSHTHTLKLLKPKKFHDELLSQLYSAAPFYDIHMT